MQRYRLRNTRTIRLRIGPQFIAENKGKRLVRGYMRRFGVDRLCAVLELNILGKNLPIPVIVPKKKQNPIEEFNPDSDATFAFIAGYTSGGAPYGVTWEEMNTPAL